MEKTFLAWTPTNKHSMPHALLAGTHMTIITVYIDGG